MLRSRALAAGALILWTAIPLTGAAEPAAESAASPQEATESSGEAPPEKPAVPRAVRSAQTMTLQSDALLDEVRELDREFARSKGEDREVLEKQVAELKLEWLALQGRLVDNLFEQEDQGLDAGELRTRLSRELEELGPAIVRHLEAAQKDLDELRGSREEIEVEDGLAFEQRVDRETVWLDKLFAAYLSLITWKEKLGLDESDERLDLGARLEQRAKRDAGRLDLVSRQLSDVGKRAVGREDDPKIVAETAALQARKKVLTNSLSSTVKQMGAMGLDAAAYQQLLITATGEVTADIFKPKVALGLLDRGLVRAKEWAFERGPDFGFKLIIFLLIVTAFRVLASIVRRLVVGPKEVVDT